jgi:hypothetical protein
VGVLVGGEGVADVDVFEAGESDDVAGGGGFDLALAEAGEFKDFGDLGADFFSGFGVGLRL